MRAIVVAGILLLAAVAPWTSQRAAAQDQKPFELSVILSLTGSDAFSALNDQQALQIIEGIVNKTGGIQHHPLKIAFLDDQSNPAVAVQLANGIIAKNQAVFLGPNLTANCRAVAALIEKSGPVGYCFSPGYTPSKGSFDFSAAGNSFDESEGYLRYFRSRHWNRVAILETTDATGQAYDNAYTHNVTLPENASITIVAQERMGISDISINAQLQRIKAARPDVLLLAMSGSPGGTVLRDLSDAGLNVPVATGLQNMTWPDQFAAVLPKEIVFAGRVGMSMADTPKGPVRDAQAVLFDGFKAAGKTVNSGVGLCWDPSWIAINALRHVGVDATSAQIHDYIENTHGFAGINGSYDFGNGDQRGLEDGSVKVFRWDAASKSFIPVSRPGGAAK